MQLGVTLGRLLWRISLISGLGITLILSSIYLYLAPNLPAVEQLRDTKLQVPLRVYSRNLKLIGEFGEKRRIPLTLDETPPAFIKAVLAAEDDRFYEHGGVDLTGLMRAASELVISGEIQSGGSTITMQVARNFFLSSEQKFARKFNEILLALQIERELTKGEILELYINKIYLGHRAYGLGAAAQIYYGTSPQNLSLAQLAMIAGLPKAPSTKNPLTNPEAALSRRNWILGRMLKMEYIDENHYEQAKLEPVTASRHELITEFDAPYVAEMARQFALEQFGNEAYTEGFRVITTIDESLQQVAQNAIRNAVQQYDLRHGYRGPEQTIQIPDTATEEDARGLFRDTIKSIPVVAENEPAVITEITDNSITVLSTQDIEIKFNWEKINEQLSPYLNENKTGSPADTPNEIFQIGDVVRILKDQEDKDGDKTRLRWRLTQVPSVQAALISLNPDNGAIISMVGGFDFRQSKYNRILQANRQPGSNFKPFFYTTALENGFTAASLLNDSPIVFEDSNLENSWRPENAGGKFLGPIRLRKALYLSRNLVSIRLLKQLGIKKAIDGALRFGFDKNTLPKDLSLALGSLSVPPIKIAIGYASFANGGYKVEPYLVETITDINFKPIYEATPLTVCREICEQRKKDQSRAETTEDNGSLDSISSAENPGAVATIEGHSNTILPEAQRIIDERTAYIMDSMLKDVIKRGTGRKALSLDRGDIAGKTGTTNGPTDVWFSGYSPHIVTTTWLGFDNNKNLGKREFGGSAALPIWIDYMRAALRGKEEIMRPQPEGLTTVRIDAETGERAKPGQSNTLFEIFKAENIPPELSSTGRPNDNNQPQEILPDEVF